VSLTYLIENKHFPELRNQFKLFFPTPSYIKTSILASPLSSNYGLVGQAFDYLFRFYLEHKYKHKIVKKNGWVADHAYAIINLKYGKSKSTELLVGKKRIVRKDRKQVLRDIKIEYKKTKINYRKYLIDGRVTIALLKSCLFLARLDLFIRAGMIDENIGNENDLDIKDLQNLYRVINKNNFKVKGICFLNPTFGKGSLLVGGADADLVLDDTLIELKVVMKLAIKRSYFNQLIGYYLLSLLGGINKDPDMKPIQKVGIYFARYGYLWVCPINELAPKDKMDKFYKWFIEYVNNQRGQGQL
jgi:hypothetical protein